MPPARIQNCQRASRSLHTRRSSTIGMSWYEATMMLSVIHPSVTVWVRAARRGAADHDAHEAGLELVRVVQEAALVELRVEEHGSPLVEDDEALSRRERVEPLEDPDHGLLRVEPAHRSEEGRGGGE